MARTLKPQKVGNVYEKTTGVSVDIMLDRENLTFFADVAGEKITGKSAEEVREATLKHIKETAFTGLVWKPYIIVEKHFESGVSTSFGGQRYEFCTTIQVEFYRIELAETSQKTFSGAPVYYMRPFLNEEGLIDREEEPRAEHASSRVVTPTAEALKAAKARNARKRKAGEDVEKNYTLASTDVRIDYTPEVWAALQALRAQMITAIDKLDQLLGKNTAAKNLTQIGEAMKLPLLTKGGAQ